MRRSKYAQLAKEVAPNEAVTDDTIGWVHYRKGLCPTAVRYLEEAVSRRLAAAGRCHLAMAYFKTADRRRGKKDWIWHLRWIRDCPRLDGPAGECRDATETRKSIGRRNRTPSRIQSAEAFQSYGWPLRGTAAGRRVSPASAVGIVNSCVLSAGGVESSLRRRKIERGWQCQPKSL